ncbi:MAG: hypothetical protein ABL921_26250 [Pirellula sp.]
MMLPIRILVDERIALPHIHVFRLPVQGRHTQRSVFKPGESLLPIADCTKALELQDFFGK